MNSALKIGVMKVIKDFFSQYFVSVSQTKKELSPAMPLYVVTIITPSPRSKGLNNMSDVFKNVFRYIIQEMCIALLHKNQYMLRHVSDHFKTQEMWDTTVYMDPGTISFITSDGVLLRMPSVLLFFIPDHFKTQEMCEKAIGKYRHILCHVPGYFKTQEMCCKAVREDSFPLVCVHDWFVTQQQVKIWHDDDKDDDGLIEWCDGHEKLKQKSTKTKKQKLKEN